MTELWRWNAADLATAIARRDVSSREVTAGVLSRIEAVNPAVHAVVDVLAEQALSAAVAADAAVARGDALGPLHGVPVTIKVNVDMAGHATTDGVAAFRDNVAEQDSPPVANLRSAGAVIVGRTNTPAFSLRWFCDNELHGRTHNPWAPDLTPGGSSGGAAAALASGMGPIAHGNDYGGSIRYPAYACGVVGMRPTVGRVPTYNGTSTGDRSITLQLMSVQGVLTRTVTDAEIALRALSTGDPRDPIWTPAALELSPTALAQRVAVFAESDAYRADPAVTAAVRHAAGWLSDAGWQVDEIEPPHFEEAAELWRLLVYDDLRSGDLDVIDRLGDDAVRTNLRYSFEGRAETSRTEYLAALARRHTIGRAWSRHFDHHPVLLLPTSWELPFRVGDDITSLARFREVVAAQSPLLATALLGLPGLSVPTAVAETPAGRAPVGVQLVSRQFHELAALRAGAVIEAAAGFDVLQRLWG